MKQKERLQSILRMLQEDPVVDVKSMAESFNVTPKTIRLDLKLLANSGHLERIHGGAIRPKDDSDFTIKKTRSSHQEEKKAIARKALTFIQENDVILLDSGSTTLEVAKLLGDFNVAVITNDIFIINELANKRHVTLYVVGGMVQNVADHFTIIGEDAVSFVRKYHTTKTFISTSAIDLDKGTSIYYYGDSSTKRAFMDAGEINYCLVDSSKFGHFGFRKVADIDELQNIITDKNISPEDYQKLKKHNINVYIGE